MFKCICILVWVVSLSCVCAGVGLKSAADFDILKKECLNEFGITEAEFVEATMTGVLTKINPCYYACHLKKTGIMTEKGEYDPSIYLRDLKEILRDNDSLYAQFKEITLKCESVKNETVSDGEAGCEMGVLVTACLQQETSNLYSSSIAQR